MTESQSLNDPGDSLMAYAKPHARTLRSNRNGTGYSFLNLGSNKIFILAAAPKVPENYQNYKVFLDKVFTENFMYHFAIDLKMTNICLGIITHAALHPCP